MKRLLYALLPWTVLTAAAVGQMRSADVLYTHFDANPTHGLRVGDECFVTLDDVKTWGWTTDIWADTASVKAEGKSFDVPFRTINGQKCIPIITAIRKIGGNADWIDNSDTLAVYGTINAIRVKDGKLNIETSMEFRSHAMTLSNPTRLVVDFTGIRLDPHATKVELDSNVHVEQFRPNVVRLVIESASDISLDRLNIDASHEMEVVYRSPDADIAAPESPKPPPPAIVPEIRPHTSDPNPGTSTQLVPAPPTPVVVNGKFQVAVDSESDGQLIFHIPVQTKLAPIIEKSDVSNLRLTIQGAVLTADPDYRVDSPSILSTTTVTANGNTVVTFAMARPMAAEIVLAADGIHVKLIKPAVGNGKLAGKLIVVDAGHGGHDPGAHREDVQEKDLTLAIAKLVADGLTREGANVIMTRDSDVFIPLSTRAEIANRSHADLFISNHINTTGDSSRQSGSITFHHIGKTVSRVLAECIEEEIAKVSGVPSIGVWSDGRIYHSGFAVLRETKMPGVLIEYGFINHPHDRQRMITDDFQKSVAAAVVRGIKVYLGDAKASN